MDGNAVFISRAHAFDFFVLCRHHLGRHVHRRGQICEGRQRGDAGWRCRSDCRRGDGDEGLGPRAGLQARGRLVGGPLF